MQINSYICIICSVDTCVHIHMHIHMYMYNGIRLESIPDSESVIFYYTGIRIGINSAKVLVPGFGFRIKSICRVVSRNRFHSAGIKHNSAGNALADYPLVRKQRGSNLKLVPNLNPAQDKFFLTISVCGMSPGVSFFCVFATLVDPGVSFVAFSQRNIFAFFRKIFLKTENNYCSHALHHKH